MAIEVEIDKRAGVAVMRVRKSPSRNEARSALDELLAHPNYTPGMNVIAVLEEGSVARFTSPSVQAIADHAMARRERLGSNYRLALVVSSTVDFGVSRMYEAWSQHLPREVELFHSLADAYEWVSAEVPATGVRSCGPQPSRPTAKQKR